MCPTREGQLLILTGYEETDRCYWCGGELSSRRLCYCSIECQLNYYRNFCWIEAEHIALREAKYTCRECGERNRLELEVHHIIPLNGGYRMWNVLNKQENLKVLCLECHKKYRKTNTKQADIEQEQLRLPNL